jgi:hypothetical protein
MLWMHATGNAVLLVPDLPGVAEGLVDLIGGENVRTHDHRDRDRQRNQLPARSYDSEALVHLSCLLVAGDGERPS